jgi:hypothetical protein
MLLESEKISSEQNKIKVKILLSDDVLPAREKKMSTGIPLLHLYRHTHNLFSVNLVNTKSVIFYRTCVSTSLEK